MPLSSPHRDSIQGSALLKCRKQAQFVSLAFEFFEEGEGRGRFGTASYHAAVRFKSEKKEEK